MVLTARSVMKKFLIFCTLVLLSTGTTIAADTITANSGAGDNATYTGVPIADNNTISVALQSVMILALKNNLDIQFASLQPQIAETDITRQEAAFDTLLSSQFTKYYENKPVGNTLAGSNSSPEMWQERYDFDATLQKKFTLGTQAQLQLHGQQYESSLPFQGLKPQYSGELVLSITQPLLRDFGIDINKSMISIANLNSDISVNQFKKQVMDVLYQIEAYYWDLTFRLRDLKSKKKSMTRAEDLLREFKIRIEAGTLAPIEIYQAKAEVALRREDVIVAESNVKKAEDNIKAALNLYNDEKYWDTVIIPADAPYTENEPPELIKNIKIALENRPDFKEARLNIQASNINVKYTKNQTLPRIDFIGSLGTYGLAGRPQKTGTFLPKAFSNPSPWTGHWNDVYDSMTDGDFYSYSFGLKLEFPLENRLAKSQYSKARVQAAQAITSLKNRENIIINEVRAAIRLINTSNKVIETALASLYLSKEKLKAEEKKYKVGMSTTHDLLEFQEELAKAESTLAYAQTEHAKSIANLQRVTGVLIEAKGLAL